MPRDEVDERLAGDLELVSHCHRTDGAELVVVRREQATQLTVINTAGVWAPFVLDDDQRRQLIGALGGVPAEEETSVVGDDACLPGDLTRREVSR
ncbi:hypothetical protein [Gordonia sp. (in: high G+C Gram-positive bacteria)]|jgi:hypothetical protein|uniref:hypothetical protein n=1 Tax=Gordonia sp. (in: high G+C Gram-positive bacteria) TaxID=84139 RepID=UPI001DD72CD5|nr:hypothetical protein [Gordonia sp. (in: high G+C Gram-positive bacteria)]MCB1297082.1 hypothetical protein [Gordonia sp. (in: high G+C Gram-positive bacteria)]HMS74152.1 hypothetical protein [Gordonia sp. (in: high G+C Gram-positive bacteria)]HQV17379.1 hypothetical protein [Gordonia sp. (in: high G+C Gram-positive bacteria)]